MKQTYVDTTHFVGIAVVAGLLGIAGPLQATSVEPTIDWPNQSTRVTDTGAIPKAQDALSKDGTMPIAQILTKVETQVDGDGIAVVVSGDGVLRYEMHAIGERRLVCDITNVQSLVAQSQLAVDHSVLKRIRFGHHPDKVRLVFDLARPAQHSVESVHGRLIITFKNVPSIPSAATLQNQDRQLAGTRCGKGICDSRTPGEPVLRSSHTGLAAAAQEPPACPSGSDGCGA